jgi:PKD repeat protein
MINQTRRNFQEKLSPVSLCLVIGILGGSLVFITEWWLGIIWAPATQYDVGIVMGFQRIGAFILGLLMIGVISHRIVRVGNENDFSVINRGILTVLFASMTILIGLMMGSDSFPLGVPNLAFVTLVIVFASIILGGMGAYFLYFWDHREKLSPSLIPKWPVWAEGRKSQFVIALILIFLFIFGPPVVAYAGIWAGIIQKTQDCCGVVHSPGNPLSTGNDSIERNQSLKTKPGLVDNKFDTNFSNKNTSYWIKIDPIGTIHMVDPVTINATTNLPEYTKVIFQIYRTGHFNCAGNWCNRSYDISGIIGVKKGYNGINRVSIGVNSSDLMLDEFIVQLYTKKPTASGHELVMVLPAKNISAPPIADFSWKVYDNQTFPVVKFEDVSDNYPASRNWSFGDGNFSTDSPVLHVFPIRNAIYRVDLTSTNPNGTDTKVQMMRIPDLSKN